VYYKFSVGTDYGLLGTAANVQVNSL